MFVLMSSVLVGSANNFRELQKPFSTCTEGAFNGQIRQTGIFVLKRFDSCVF